MLISDLLRKSNDNMKKKVDYICKFGEDLSDNAIY